MWMEWPGYLHATRAKSSLQRLGYADEWCIRQEVNLGCWSYTYVRNNSVRDSVKSITLGYCFLIECLKEGSWNNFAGGARIGIEHIYVDGESVSSSHA
jgi:hypothetical protein